jgi:hypothetical protein
VAARHLSKLTGSPLPPERPLGTGNRSHQTHRLHFPDSPFGGGVTVEGALVRSCNNLVTDILGPAESLIAIT